MHIPKRGGRYLPTEDAWLRVRSCVGNPSHTIETLERVHALDALRVVSVRSRQGVGPYQRNDLLRDLSWTLSKVLSKKERNHVAAVVEARLMPLLPPRREQRKSFVLESAQIFTAVSEALKEEGLARGRDQASGTAYRRAHIMWELARGRFDDKSDGFGRLADIEEWLAENYELAAKRRQRTKPPRPHYREGRVDEWHPLANNAAPHPHHVIHRYSAQRTVALRTETVREVHVINDDVNAYQELDYDPSLFVRTEVEVEQTEPDWIVERGVTEDRYEAEPFDIDRFTGTVRRAFHGRIDSEHRTRYAVQWVLWALAGQAVIRSSDLAAMTTQCLRRVDAIAYLRWSIVAKNLTLEGVWQEIQGMRDWPASRLTFPADAAADNRTSLQIQPDIWDQFDSPGGQTPGDVEDGTPID